MNVGPNMQAAIAVADAINGAWPSQVERPDGVEFSAVATRFPKMKREDVGGQGTLVFVVPVTPYTITVVNRGDAINRECPVNILIVEAVPKADHARQEKLFALHDAITELLLWVDVPGFGFPDADEGIAAEWDADELYVNGLFFAVVGAMYGMTEEVDG